MQPKTAHLRMMDKAVDYLCRYASSRHRLALILRRFADRKLTDYDPDDITTAIQQTINQCSELGYLDDQQFAVSLARGQRRLGRSQTMIRQRLRQHAIDDDLIAHAMAEADENSSNGDLQAAIRFAQRRRLGPFAQHRRMPNQRLYEHQLKQKDLGAMARAGFSLTVSRQILDHDNPHTINNLLCQAD